MKRQTKSIKAKIASMIGEKMKSAKYSTMLTFLILLDAWLCLIFLPITVLYIHLTYTSDESVMRIIYGCMTAWFVYNLLRNFLELMRKLLWRYRRRKRGVSEDPIPADHGSCLADVIEGIRGEKVEYVAYFSPSGEKICESTINSPTTTLITAQDNELVRSQPGCVAVHNHPGDDNQAFSENDIVSGVVQRLSRTIVVTQSLCFVMDFPKDHNLDHKEIREFFKNIPSGAVAIRVGGMIATQLNSGFCEAMSNPNCLESLMRCSAAAAHFGFEFWATPTDKEYNSLLKEKR